MAGKVNDKEGHIISEAMKFATIEEFREWLREHGCDLDPLYKRALELI
ncbi:hypothetical protein [Robinsoniella peoriensis]